MPLLIILIAVLASLVLFAQQNWSPSLALVFLGNSTKPLPLAMWMLGAFVLGAFTTVILSGLMRFAGYQIAQELAESDEVDEPPRSPSTPRRSAVNRYSQTDDDGDDWADEDWLEDSEDRTRAPSTTSRVASESNEDDDDDDRPEPVPQDSRREQPASPTVEPPKDYERSQQPQRSTQDGSAYSYSYRESARSGVGRTEAVYDAEFRVLIPPYSPETPNESGKWEENAPRIPEPEDEEEVWDGAEDEDWAGSSDRNDDWAEDDTSSAKRR